MLATGVNPGFAMDALALALTAPCARVRRVSVTRVVDAAARRLPLQRKVGAGLNLGQFRRAVTEGSVRHVGLVESAHMIAGALGWKLDRVDETLEPAIAPRDLDTEYLRIPAGAAAGIKQAVRAYRDGRARDQPRPADLRRGRVAARPRPRGRRPAGRRHDRGRGQRRARHRGRAPVTASRSCWPPRPAC